MQFDLDQLDQSAAVNVVGGPIGRVQATHCAWLTDLVDHVAAQSRTVTAALVWCMPPADTCNLLPC